MSRHVPKVAHHYFDEAGGRISRFNSWLALKVTSAVGTMWCAYAFTLLALVSLPAALASGDVVVIVGWIAQTLIQLVLLSVIMVGSNVQALAADARAQATYEDTERILSRLDDIEKRLS